MRIALLIVRWFPHGGLQRDLLAIGQRLAALDHQVTVLTTSWQGPMPDGMAVATLPVPAATNHGRDAAFAQRALRHAALLSADRIAGFDKLPGLDWYYQGDRCYAARVRPWLRLTARYRAKRALEQAVFGPDSGTRILLLNEREGAVFRQVYGTPADRFHLLPPNLDPARLAAARAGGHPEATRRLLGIAPEERLLLMVASAIRTKGIDRAIRAVASLPDGVPARLAIAGAADERRLAALGERLGGAARLRILGPREDIPDLMQAADLLIHPARRENTGTVLVEALACGLPVLCSGACGYAEHVARAEAGQVLAEPFRQAALDEALAQILTGRHLSGWSANARRYRDSTPLTGGPDRAAALIASG